MPKTLKGEYNKTSLTIEANDSGKLPSEIQILPVGKWNTMAYGPLEITMGHLDEMVKNFNAGVRKGIPVDTDHDGGAANGWITDLINKGTDGLWGKVKWTRRGKELLEEGIYKLFSAEWSFDYIDPQTGARHGAVLVAGTLTNRPLMKELPSLVANDKAASDTTNKLTSGTGSMLLLFNEPMNKLKDILSKPTAERTEEEVKFLEEHKAELTEEQKAQMESESKPSEETPKEEGKEEETPAAPATETPKEEETPKEGEQPPVTPPAPEAETPAPSATDVKANEQTVTLTASEVESYKKAAEELQVLKAAEHKRKVEDEVQVFVANEKGGKILPKSKDGLVSLILSASEEQKSAIMNFLNELPEIKIAGEKGDSTNEPLTASEKVIKLIEEYKANDKLTEAEAQDRVKVKHPALWAEYNKAL